MQINRNACIQINVSGLIEMHEWSKRVKNSRENEIAFFISFFFKQYHQWCALLCPSRCRSPWIERRSSYINQVECNVQYELRVETGRQVLAQQARIHEPLYRKCVWEEDAEVNCECSILFSLTPFPLKKKDAWILHKILGILRKKRNTEMQDLTETK